MNTQNKQVPVKAGIWTDKTPDGSIALLGSKCTKCGELFFPKRDGTVCTHCQCDTFEEIQLSSRGTIFTFTEIMIRPPGYYKGEVPYAIGWVDLPEGIKVETQFTQVDFEDLKIGMEVEMILETLHTEEDGTEVICYKFRPATN